MAYLNGMIWSFGNGLVSTMLVVYLAMDLGLEVVGLGVSLILAAPHIVGLLRMGAPAMIRRLGDRKTFCLATFALSGLTLLALPLTVAGRLLPSARASLYALVAVWCVFHLFQYLATVALWSWLADLVPLRIRGRFIGRRERSMVAAGAVAMISAGLFAHCTGEHGFDWPAWIRYTVPTLLGSLFMLAAIVPLARMPRVGPSQTASTARRPSLDTLKSLAAPLRDRRFLGLILFGCWLSFFNGVTQSAHYVYGWRVLGVGLFAMLSLRTITRVGQFSLSPTCGRLADRLGNRPVLIPCLFLVAQGPLFYFFSTPGHPWWLAVAWIVWIAYAGINVALPNLMLRLSPQRSNAPYIAAYYAITGLCYAAATITGGYLVDSPQNPIFQFCQTVAGMGHYQAIFLLGWLARMAAVPILILLVAAPGKPEIT
jgi:MFS family permease